MHAGIVRTRVRDSVDSRRTLGYGSKNRPNVRVRAAQISRLAVHARLAKSLYNLKLADLTRDSNVGGKGEIVKMSAHASRQPGHWNSAEAAIEVSCANSRGTTKGSVAPTCVPDRVAALLTKSAHAWARTIVVLASNASPRAH